MSESLTLTEKSKSIVKDKQHYNSIDLFKLLMAFCVVAIHTEPLYQCTNETVVRVYKLFVDMAVPFFFLVSGFLLSSKMHDTLDTNLDLSKVLFQLKKIIKMYIIWTIIYLPLAVYGYIKDNTPFIKAVLQYFRRFLFVGEQYNSWQLWYLLSTIYTLLVVYLVLKKVRSYKSLLLISLMASVISLVVAFVFNNEDSTILLVAILHKITRYTIGQGRIITGLIYIPIGMVLYKRKIKLYLNYIMLICGFIANYLVNNNIISFFLLIITCVGLFGVVEKIDLKNNPIYIRLRNMSTIIYLIHMYVWTFYYIILYGEKTFGMYSFIITTIICTAISILYVEISFKSKQKSVK